MCSDIRLKRKEKAATRTMQCKRRRQWGVVDDRGARCPRNEYGGDCKNWAKQGADGDVPCQDPTRSRGDSRRAKLSARPPGTCGGGNEAAVWPPDQCGLVALGEKQATEVPARDRMRPGREAPGRLRRPTPLGCLCQEGSVMDPTRKIPTQRHQPDHEKRTPRPRCCLDTEWTCGSCGTTWYRKTAKNE